MDLDKLILMSESYSIPNVPQKPRRTRTIFVSLPSDDDLIKFVKVQLEPKILNRWSRLELKSYLNLKQGRWLPKIERMIIHSNLVIAFLSELNSNVLFEVGQATSLGKPIILIAPDEAKIPSMLKYNQVIILDSEEIEEKHIHKILDAIDESVFSALNKEKSDKRTQIQKKLLLGAEKTPAYTEIKDKKNLSNYSKEEELLSIAEEYFHKGDFPTVKDILESHLIKGTHNQAIYHLLADTYYIWGEGNVKHSTRSKIYQRMLEVSEEGILRCPGDNFLLRKDRGLALLKLGKLTESKKQFEQLYQENPSIPFVPYNLACIYSILGERNSSIFYLRKAIELREDYQELARVDSDFDSIWDDVLFQSLVFQFNKYK